MERLRFTYSHTIDHSEVKYYDDTKNKLMQNFFLCSFGETIFKFDVSILQNIYEGEIPTNVEYVKLYAGSNPGRLLPEHCTCKFTLQRPGHSDLEYTVVGREWFGVREGKENYCHPLFEITKDHAISKVLGSFFQNPKDVSPVLRFELELPKKAFFARNWFRHTVDPPIGWENDERYKVLTAEDKHDLHINCTDGVYYTKKRKLTRKSEYFEEKFENEWKDKSEIKMDITVETMHLFVNFWFTNTFLPQKKLNPDTLDKIQKYMGPVFHLPHNDWYAFFNDIDWYLCCQLSQDSLSLYDLISWWKQTNLLRANMLVISMILKNYYAEIIKEYTPDAKFTDKQKTEIHKTLFKDIHEDMPESQTLYELLACFHDIIEKVVVTEIFPENIMNK